MQGCVSNEVTETILVGEKPTQMKSQNGLRANFAQNSSQTFQVVFTDNLNAGECYLQLRGIPNKELADSLADALQLFSVSNDTGKFTVEPEEFDLTQTLIPEQNNIFAPKSK